MNTREKIIAEITNHGKWKGHLIQAIQTGESKFDPVIIKTDNQCSFGKWLYQNVDELQKSPHYQTVRQLHAQFHVEAARILEIALKGQADEALLALAPNKKYGKLSTMLTSEMTKWSLDLIEHKFDK